MRGRHMLVLVLLALTACAGGTQELKWTAADAAKAAKVQKLLDQTPNGGLVEFASGETAKLCGARGRRYAVFHSDNGCSGCYAPLWLPRVRAAVKKVAAPNTEKFNVLAGKFLQQ